MDLQNLFQFAVFTPANGAGKTPEGVALLRAEGYGI